MARFPRGLQFFALSFRPCGGAEVRETCWAAGYRHAGNDRRRHRVERCSVALDPAVTGSREKPVTAWNGPLPCPIVIADRRNNRLIEIAPDRPRVLKQVLIHS